MPRRPVAQTPVPPRRRRSPPTDTEGALGRLARRLLRGVLMLAAAILMIDALFGDHGFVETMRARREHDELAATIARLKAENARLREQARQLREDPTAVEALARKELGLVRPGELLFIVKDAPTRKMR